MIQQITKENIVMTAGRKDLPVSPLTETSRGLFYRTVVKIARAVQSIFASFLKLFRAPVSITIGGKTPITDESALKNRLSVIRENLPLSRSVDTLWIFGSQQGEQALFLEKDPGILALPGIKKIILVGNVVIPRRDDPAFGDHLEKKGWTFMNDEDCIISHTEKGKPITTDWTPDLASQCPVPYAIYHFPSKELIQHHLDD